MIILKGKYNLANIMLEDESQLEEATRQQIYSLLNHPAFADTYISIMPDCHVGVGSVIGFTMKMNKYIIPNIVGVDIGCGMLMTELDGVDKINFPEFDKYICNKIPSGFSKHVCDKNGNNKPFHRNMIEIDEIHGINKVSDVVGTKFDDVICSLGTLGGGNHFIEIDKGTNDKYYLVIHSGSRIPLLDYQKGEKNAT